MSESLTSNIKSRFIELPTRPMYIIEINPKNLNHEILISNLKQQIFQLDANSIVKVKLTGIHNSNYLCFSTRFLRSIAPETMNIELMISN